MNLEKYFNMQAKTMMTDAKDKDEVLNAIATSAKATKALKKVSLRQLQKKLKDRESIGSTGFGDGIAIPHCSFKEIDTFVIGVLRSEEGIEFNAIDGKPVKLLIYIIAPSDKRNEHIRILSEIAKVLKEPDNLNALLKHHDLNEFFKDLSRLGQWDNNEETPQEFSQLTIHIQDSRVFNQILELFAEVKGVYISVIDGNNVGKYLYAIPLFSHFLNEEHKGFHRLILGVVNTTYVNDILRKIIAIINKYNCESKVMITSHSLNFFYGGIDI
jgi:PTS system nitrogen regulatory IIA component